MGKHSSGQATVEFTLAIILIMGFSLFYIQLCCVFAWANYIHYATFMSARAYLASGPSQEDQEERATQVITRMLKRSTALPGQDRLPALAKGGPQGEVGVPGFFIRAPSGFNGNDRHSSWMEGARYRFRSRLFVIPFGMGGDASSVNQVTLQSESWLGRERSYEDCINEMEKRSPVWDNGC